MSGVAANAENEPPEGVEGRSDMMAADETTLPGIHLSDMAEKILAARYLRRDSAGVVVETPEEMFGRVARAIAAVEDGYGGDRAATADRFYGAMSGPEWLPSSPILMNAGTESPQFPACFVLAVPDSMEGIMGTLKDAAMVQKAGGGTGFSFSRLRPRGAAVRGTGGVASGPVPFMRMFDGVAEAVKQGGRRRAANMAVLRVDHPDIEDFIRAKLDGTSLQTFNISVGVTDRFMTAVEGNGSVDLVAPHTGRTVASARARDLLHLIAEAAWRTGDPGVLFLDTINRANPTPALGEVEATNPCGEQPLLPGEACVLGSISLTRHLRDGQVDREKLGETVWLAVRFLDSCIDRSSYPLPEIETATKANRKIGLGVMGLAHMLALNGVPYGSTEALALASSTMEFISTEALGASRQLAKERGPFPNFQKSVYAERREPPVRNATRTTVAPTGTISILADTSSGIEPMFAPAYTRTALDGQTFRVVDPVFRRVARERGILDETLIEQIAAAGSVQGIDRVPADMKAVFRTAHEIPPGQHVEMQAAIQRHTDNAVSKTVNLASSATVEDVERIFMHAHRLGCKGITVFRQGCRTPVLGAGLAGRAYARMRARPAVTLGRTQKFKTGCGSVYIHVNHDDTGLLEVFSNLGKGGGGCPAQSEASARLVSLSLRCEVDPAEVVRQLRGIRCPTACSARAEGAPVDVLSCPDAIARALSAELGDSQPDGPTDGPFETCRVCGGPREPGRCGVCLKCWEGGCEGT